MNGNLGFFFLGGKVVTHFKDCSVLVTDRIRRTVKFLCCVGLGVPIVGLDWLEKCRASGKFLGRSCTRVVVLLCVLWIEWFQIPGFTCCETRRARRSSISNWATVLRWQVRLLCCLVVFFTPLPESNRRLLKCKVKSYQSNVQQSLNYRTVCRNC